MKDDLAAAKKRFGELGGEIVDFAESKCGVTLDASTENFIAQAVGGYGRFLAAKIRNKVLSKLGFSAE